MSVNFENVNGESLSIQDVFPYTDGCGLTKGTASTGDAIQIQTADGYDVYFLSDGNFTVKGKTTYYADRDGKWFKAATTSPTSDGIPVGTGAWYGRKGTADFTITVDNPTAAN